MRGAFVQTNLKVASLRLSPLGRVSVDTFHCVDVSKHKVGQGFVIGDISKSGVESREELGEFGLPVIVRRRDEPFITTHRSALDGSVQPITLLVPPHYEPQRTYSLLVALHGAKGCLIGHAFSVKRDFIIVAPHGKGQTGYRDFGEVDVKEAIAEVKRRYRIDEDPYLLDRSLNGRRRRFPTGDSLPALVGGNSTNGVGRGAPSGLAPKLASCAHTLLSWQRR